MKGGYWGKARGVSTALAFGLLLSGSVSAGDLPAPFVSRALDAVLLPMSPEVATTFGVENTDGAFVLAIQPSGTADAAGILPGDIIQGVADLRVYSPAQVDEAVYHLLKQGTTDFDIIGYRVGQEYRNATTVTVESWEETIDIVQVSSWSSYSYSEFSYEEFYSEYSAEMEASYSEATEGFEESSTVDEAQDVDGEDTAAGDEEAECIGQIIDGACVENDQPAEEDMPADDEVIEEDVGGDDEGGGDEEIVE